MLQITDLSIAYGDKTVIEGFNLEVAKKEIVCIVGESGSGKTTLIKTIMGLLPKNAKILSGEIIYNGEDILRLNKKEAKKFHGEEMAIIFQDSANMLNPIRKIESQYIEYINTHRKMPKEEAKKLIKEKLDMVGMINSEAVMKNYPFELSGGMSQRLGIAMAMTFTPKLLIADEPTSALDSTLQSQILFEMKKLKDNYDTGIIIITHNLGVAAILADKVIVMKDGKIVEQGSKYEVIENPQSDYARMLIDSIPKFRE